MTSGTSGKRKLSNPTQNYQNHKFSVLHFKTMTHIPKPVLKRITNIYIYIFYPYSKVVKIPCVRGADVAFIPFACPLMWSKNQEILQRTASI